MITRGQAIDPSQSCEDSYMDSPYHKAASHLIRVMYMKHIVKKSSINLFNSFPTEFPAVLTIPATSKTYRRQSQHCVIIRCRHQRTRNSQCRFNHYKNIYTSSVLQQKENFCLK